MKCDRISIGDTTPTYNRTLEQFRASDRAKSSWGRLVIALARESVWSSDYRFHAWVYEDAGSRESHLLIYHPIFFPGLENSLVFGTGKDDGKTDVSVHGVENAVRVHLDKIRKSLEPGIAKLQQDVRDLVEAALQIVVKKARATISAAFPEVNSLEFLPFQAPWPSLYVFRQGVDDGPMYIARAVDNEIVGGIARITCGYSTWNRLREEERHTLFWSEIAWTFAARYLSIPEGQARGHGRVSVTQKSLQSWIEQPETDAYDIEKVTFSAEGKRDIVVTFGDDNLPVNVYVTEPETRAVGLVDRHMTP